MALLTRGDVYAIRLAGPGGGGREQSGSRYGVVVQVDELLGLSTVIVAPTSRSARPATFRPVIEIGGEPTRVLVEQVRVVDLGRIGAFATHLRAGEMQDVDRALALVLGIG